MDAKDLILEGKRIAGFQLAGWLQTKGILFKLRFMKEVRKNLAGTLSSLVDREFDLQEVEEALRYYREKSFPGKILLKTKNN